SRDASVWESAAMTHLLTGLRIAVAYLATFLATAVRRPFRPPPRPSWSIGDEARARYLRGFLRRLHGMAAEPRRRELDSVPVLIPGALLRTRRRRATLGGVPVSWVTPRSGGEPRLVLYVHGGGFSMGSSRAVRDLLARLALAGNTRVLAVDYRL